ncbi:hypothetical protein F4802DRAFT_602963 [Xylaria palmicola]|nr:hypothetical protein F4802DRAFT_602963 [Xylaria palmicola]
MDPTSTPFSSPEDRHPLSHDAHPHSSQPPPAQTFRISALPSHSTLSLSMDAHDAVLQHQLQRLNALSNMSPVHPDFTHAHHSQGDGFDRDQPPPPPAHLHRSSSISQSHPSRPHPHHTPPSPLPPHSGPPGQHQFGLMAPNVPISQSGSMPQISSEDDVFASQSGLPSLVAAPEMPVEQRPHGQLVNRIVINPPNLHAWREKLFNVDDTITLTNDEYALPKPRSRYLWC